mgnify:CR=1 FL=1
MSRLRVEDLTVAFGRRAPVVRGVGFDLDPGRRLGIVGESGSGKTVTALAIMGLLPENARVTGSIRLGDTELVGLGDKAVQEINRSARAAGVSLQARLATRWTEAVRR